MTPNMKVPFLDLVAPHLELEEELVAVFRNTLRTAGFIGGPVVEGFEHEFAQFCDVKYCIGVGSGTDAVRFALMASGVQPGDVVVTVPNTFIATTEAISQAGALPEFVDVDEHTYNMDPEKLGEYLANCKTGNDGSVVSRRSGRRVTAIVPVHLYGQMANMDPIMDLAQRYKLLVIEDACQAHGAEYFSARSGAWKKAGSMGQAASFSFYPGKNLGACGEAGAVTTNDSALAEKIKMLRDHGQAKKYYHDVEGYNGRLDAVQAGLLHTKLQYLPKWNAQRRECAVQYNQLLESVGTVSIPFEASCSRGVFHLYVIRTDNRDGLIVSLKDAGIGSGIHYPIPLHLQRAYRSLNYAAGDFPRAERAATRAISLPMFPTLTEEQQIRVVDEIRRFLETNVQDGLSEGVQLQTAGRSA